MRSGIDFAVGWLFSIYASVITIVCNAATWPLLVFTPGAERRRVVARAGTMMIFRLTGIGLTAEGRDNVPGGPCIVIANHRSYFDGLALICGLPPGFSPLIKDGIRRLPFVGFIMARAGSVYVRRTPAAAAARDTLRVIRRVRGGVSPAIFAEGTLSPDYGLLPLRKGAFLMAVRTGRPVVPVAIEGSRSVLPQGGRRFHRGRVRVRIGSPLYPSGRNKKAVIDLRDRAEKALWRLLSPATADWRNSLDPPKYYARSLGAGRLPAAVVDFDSVAACLRRVFDDLPSKPLYLDARALSDPALLRRIWRSNIRSAGTVFDRLDTAIAWQKIWGFFNCLVAPSRVDGQTAEQIARLTNEKHPPAIALADMSDLTEIGKLLQSRRQALEIWLRIEYDGRRSEDCLASVVREFVDACELSSNVCFGGVLVEPRPATPGIEYGDRSQALSSLVDRLATLAEPIVMLGATTPNGVQRARAVNAILVGSEIESAHSREEDGWLFAGRARRDDNGVAVEPLDCQSLASPDARRIDLYGGCVVAQRSDGRQDN